MNQVITACAFIHKDGKLFAPRRASTKSFLPDKFELPGGHIEFGEDIIEGLRREIREEFTMEIIIGDPFYAFAYMDESKQAHTIEVIYFAQLANTDELIKLNPTDHSEYKWVNEEEALKLWTEGDHERKAVVRGFEILKGKGVMSVG